MCTQRLWSSRWECARYSKRIAAETFPRTVCRDRVRARTCERRRVRARPTRPAVHYRRPTVSGAYVCVGSRTCVRERLATSTRPRSRLPAGSSRASATPPAGQSLAAVAAGRRPPAACRYSHTPADAAAPRGRRTLAGPSDGRRHATRLVVAATNLYLLIARYKINEMARNNF